jgi:hypothetical protein
MKMNSKVLFGALFLLLGIVFVVILSRPSAKENRRLKLTKEIEKNAIVTDEATWKLANSCTGFQQVSGKKYGDGIVFMPTYGGDIAQLADDYRANISLTNIKVIPLPDKNSPISEKFLKLCLVHNWNSRNPIQQGIANGPQSNRLKIEKMWDEVPEQVKRMVDGQLVENQRIFEKLGKYGGYFSFKGMYAKAKTYVGVVMSGRTVQDLGD